MWRGIGLLSLVALLAGALLAPPTHGGDVEAGKLAGLRASMQRFVDQKEVAGAVTLVGRREGVVHVEAVGSRDLAANAPMRPDALFRIASMTKPITALGIMILADEGKLAVTDPVEKHLPEFRGQMVVAQRSGDSVTLKKPSRPITVHDLLTHTSGMPGGPPPGLAELYRTRNRTLAEGVLAYSQRPLEFEPGTRWAYSNSGIDTLGRIIEVVSGQGYEAFLAQRLFEPLGMKDTTFSPRPEQLERLAATYEKPKTGELQPTTTFMGPGTGAKFPIPAGGLYSTAGDLAKLYQMMLRRGMAGDRRLVSEKSVATMTQLQTGDLKTGFVDGMGFGYGWAVVRKPAGVTAMLSPGSYGHGGAFGTQGWIDPHKDLFVVLLIQRVGLPNADNSELRRAVQEVAFAALEK